MGFALIECLPVELLQPIFMAADNNLALIQASPYIAARLSSEYIYHSTCDHHLTEVRGKRAEQSASQTFIFASRWMTWDFFQSWIMRRFGPSGCLCGRTTKEGCFDPQWPPRFEDATEMMYSRSHLPRLAFVKGRLPMKLLVSPWTQDKLEFLRFLLWVTAMSIDWTDHDTANAVVKARRQAVLDQNLEAVELFNHNRRLGRPANLDTVRFAVKEAGCDRSIVYDTLLAANMWHGPGRPRYSAELHEWCDARMAEGDPKGRWLRQKLQESCVLTSREEAEEAYNPGKPMLDRLTEYYDDIPDDTLTINSLQWNKVNPHKGWLISRMAGYTRQTINHDISWPEVVRQPGYRMYRGHTCPRRLNCWTEYNGALRSVDIWLAPPSSCTNTSMIMRRIGAATNKDA